MNITGVRVFLMIPIPHLLITSIVMIKEIIILEIDSNIFTHGNDKYDKCH